MNNIKAYELKRGMVIQRPTSNHPEPVIVARVKPGRFKSYLTITFIDGQPSMVHRNENIYLIQETCNEETSSS